MDKVSDTRKFTVAPDIIYSLIKAQAGTLAKSVGECVMNSIDAGASDITITATQHLLVISDNGRGFGTRREIEECFEVFGFDHKDAARSFGQFGIGRAQLWNFCATVWTTHTFRMEVDIKQRGLDYELIDGLAPQQGIKIEGRFYETLAVDELFAFERELKELVKYVPAAVVLNGRRISKEPAKEKWSFDTPEAWIKIRETGDLYVYNLGFFVRRFPGFAFGCGGVVVTKPGVRLALNMARNDILVSECAVWKQIKPFLQQLAAARVPKDRMTPAKRSQLTQVFLTGGLDEKTVKTAKLIQDILGRYHALGEIAPTLLWGHRPMAVGEPGNTLSEYIHRSKRGFLLAPATLERFGADTAQEFAELLKKGMTAVHPWYQTAKPVTFENFRDICRELSELRMPVPPNEWTKEEQAALTVLNQIARKLPVPRRIDLGVSDTARAWTDGTSYITFDRKTIALAQKGIGGWQLILHVLLDQSLRSGGMEDGTVQEEAFYQRFYQAVMFATERELALLETAFTLYVKACHKLGVSVNRRIIAGFDLVAGTLH